MLWQPTRGILQPNQSWRRGQGGAAALGLQTSLTAFYQFETTSWTDELGVNNLTGSNSPTSVSGVVGNAVKFDSGASMKLSHASATALVMDTSAWSVSLWANLGTASSTNRGDLMSKNDGGFGNIEWSVGTIFTSNHKWYWRFVDTFDNNQTVTSTANLATGWHHLVGTWDGTTMSLYVDGGTADTATPPLPPDTGTSSFQIGHDSGGYASASYDVMIDQVGIWKARTLSAGDVALLYNSGAGLTYAAMA